MTADDYRTALERLGLSQAEASRFLGVTDRTSRRWAAGDIDVPDSVSMLLRLMVRKRLKPEQVRDGWRA